MYVYAYTHTNMHVNKRTVCPMTQHQFGAYFLSIVSLTCFAASCRRNAFNTYMYTCACGAYFLSIVSLTCFAASCTRNAFNQDPYIYVYMCMLCIFLKRSQPPSIHTYIHTYIYACMNARTYTHHIHTHTQRERERVKAWGKQALTLDFGGFILPTLTQTHTRTHTYTQTHIHTQ
jgi:hypothetical protein